MADRNSRLVYSSDAPPTETSARERGRPKPSPRRGAGPGVRIRLDRRASSRLVTLVSGLPGSRDAVAELARVLKAACGTGGTVKDGVLELQGDQREKVEQALSARGLSFKRAGG